MTRPEPSTSDIDPAVTTSEPLAAGRPLWQRLISGGLILKFLLVLFLVWFTHVRGCNEPIDPPVDVRAVDEIRDDAWSYGPFLAGLSILLVAVFVGTRRRHLLAVTAFDLLRISAILLFAALALFGIFADYEPGSVVIRHGTWLGLAALAGLILIDASRLAWRCVPLFTHFHRTRFWSRRSLWIVPVAVADLLVGGAAIGLSALMLAWYAEEWFTSPTSPAVPIFIAFLLWTASLGLCLILAAWGLWQRQTWAMWTHLYVGVPLIAGLIRYGAIDWPDPLWTFWFLPSVLAALTWWLYGAIVGGLFAAHSFQRGRCGQCGRVRWMRAARCRVCGERYKLWKDRAAAPACLACGHEQPGPAPTCRQCRRSTPAAPDPPPSVGQSA
jgi:hypothetical protein